MTVQDLIEMLQDFDSSANVMGIWQRVPKECDVYRTANGDAAIELTKTIP